MQGMASTPCFINKTPSFSRTTPSAFIVGVDPLANHSNRLSFAFRPFDDPIPGRTDASYPFDDPILPVTHTRAAGAKSHRGRGTLRPPGFQSPLVVVVASGASHGGGGHAEGSDCVPVASSSPIRRCCRCEQKLRG